MKSSVMKAGALCAASLCVGAAVAGVRLVYPVYVDSSMRLAYGDFASTRRTFSSTEWIGCTVNSDNSVTCTAKMANGTQGYCSKYAAPQSMVNAIMNSGASGYVAFMWDANGTCTYVLSEASSRFALPT